MFTTLAAISGSVVLIATKRGDTLKAERDAKRQAELAEQLRRRQERRTFRLSEEMKAKLEAVPAEITQIWYQIGRGEAVQLTGDIYASLVSRKGWVVAHPRGVILEGPDAGKDPRYKLQGLILAFMQGYTSLGTDVSVFSTDATVTPPLARS